MSARTDNSKRTAAKGTKWNYASGGGGGGRVWLWLTCGALLLACVYIQGASSTTEATAPVTTTDPLPLGYILPSDDGKSTYVFYIRFLSD